VKVRQFKQEQKVEKRVVARPMRQTRNS
jgi:hypothetical protein